MIIGDVPVGCHCCQMNLFTLCSDVIAGTVAASSVVNDTEHWSFKPGCLIRQSLSNAEEITKPIEAQITAKKYKKHEMFRPHDFSKVIITPQLLKSKIYSKLNAWWRFQKFSVKKNDLWPKREYKRVEKLNKGVERKVRNAGKRTANGPWQWAL